MQRMDYVFEEEFDYNMGTDFESEADSEIEVSD